MSEEPEPKEARPEWAESWTDREWMELRLAEMYARWYNHGTSGHLGYTVLAKAAAELGRLEDQVRDLSRAMSEAQGRAANIEAVYQDRNQAVQALARLAQQAGYQAGMGVDPEEPDWPVLFVDLPSGQVSWHLKRDDIIGEWPAYVGKWDGHDTAEKQARVAVFAGQA
jgi:hypothetical protein